MGTFARDSMAAKKFTRIVMRAVHLSTTKRTAWALGNYCCRGILETVWLVAITNRTGWRDALPVRYQPAERTNAPERVVTISPGKTNLTSRDDMSPQVCAVRRRRHTDVIV